MGSHLVGLLRPHCGHPCPTDGCVTQTNPSPTQTQRESSINFSLGVCNRTKYAHEHHTLCDHGLGVSVFSGDAFSGYCPVRAPRSSFPRLAGCQAPGQTQEPLSCPHSTKSSMLLSTTHGICHLPRQGLNQVQLQLLTAIVKLFLKKPTETQELVQQVLSLATQVGAASLWCPAGPGSTPPPREPDQESRP